MYGFVQSLSTTLNGSFFWSFCTELSLNFRPMRRFAEWMGLSADACVAAAPTSRSPDEHIVEVN